MKLKQIIGELRRIADDPKEPESDRKEARRALDAFFLDDEEDKPKSRLARVEREMQRAFAKGSGKDEDDEAPAAMVTRQSEHWQMLDRLMGFNQGGGVRSEGNTLVMSAVRSTYEGAR